MAPKHSPAKPGSRASEQRAAIRARQLILNDTTSGILRKRFLNRFYQQKQFKFIGRQ
jgi:hypothetical protein